MPTPGSCSHRSTADWRTASSIATRSIPRLGFASASEKPTGGDAPRPTVSRLSEGRAWWPEALRLIVLALSGCGHLRRRFMDRRHVLHHFEAREKFHIAGRPAGFDHARTIGPVGGRILRPVLLESVQRIVFIVHTRGPVAAHQTRIAGRRITACADVQFRL